MEELCKMMAEKLGLTYDYVIENAPEVINEYLKFLEFSNWAAIIVCSILMIALVCTLVYTIHSYNKKEENWARDMFGLSCSAGLVIAGSITVLIALLIIAYFATIELVELNIAPNIIILEKIGELI